jgi:glycosyltransferase involved in cell wall biosynthesis
VRVAFDVTPLVQNRAGTARHVRGLLEALEGRSGLELRRLTFGGTGKLSTLLRDAIWYPAGSALAARGLDLLHCTTFRGPLRSRLPVVLTIHDLAILRHPETLPRWHRLYGRVGLRVVARAADVVLAVSEFTKREIVELLGVPAERVRVVANGLDPVFTPAGRAADGDYVLAVGTLEPRKNLDRAVEAARVAGVELRVVGPAGWGGVKARGWVGFVGDEELAQLYRGARCVVYPSLYEGFGIPVLEAMACGTPVVTSRDGATEEVAGGAAVLVDPLDSEAIAAGIDEADRRREELVPRGLARAREFTWERSANAVEAVWRELLA